MYDEDFNNSFLGAGVSEDLGLETAGDFAEGFH